ncbi:hypothetical protein ElyMa_005773200 [Elysia marginata]|uniref:Retrotransposon gag domain-containing protein n=1 Tax=Elysia marginata TaxID=1093978 RepID=A0AAV4FQI3_9GAST|nr:hypothetical protein ElyMa_005773200 [Elysia marginata]
MVDIQNYSSKLLSNYAHDPDCVHYDRTSPTSYSQGRGEKGDRHADFQPQCRCHWRRFIQPPEYLMYNGTSDCDAFRLKYRRFVREQDVSVENAMQYLSCVLTGRAAEFHASTTYHSPPCSLRNMLDRLESRFGFRPERSYRYEEFQDAYQRIGETTLEWADRIFRLASGIFHSPSRPRMAQMETEEVLQRFCTGSLDREAGLHAAFKHPQTLSEAVAYIDDFQRSRDAVRHEVDDHTPIDTRMTEFRPIPHFLMLLQGQLQASQHQEPAGKVEEDPALREQRPRLFDQCRKRDGTTRLEVRPASDLGITVAVSSPHPLTVIPPPLSIPIQLHCLLGD